VSADETAAVEPVSPPRRRRIFVPIAAVVVLAFGIAVFVLGRGAASTASDDLSKAQHRLHTQQQLSNDARKCERDVRAAVPALVTSGEKLIFVAGQIVSTDAEIVAAGHDQQRAGINADIGGYNAAANRANVAAQAGNGLIATIQQQLDAFAHSNASLPSGCSASNA
jgi:hypothetical protein